MRKYHGKQNLIHDVVKFSLMIRNDINMFLTIKLSTQVDNNIVLQVNSINDAKKIGKELMWYIGRNEQERWQYSRFSKNYWYLAETIVDKLDVPGFINLLAVFIKQEQVKAKNLKNVEDE